MSSKSIVGERSRFGQALFVAHPTLLRVLQATAFGFRNGFSEFFGSIDPEADNLMTVCQRSVSRPMPFRSPVDKEIALFIGHALGNRNTSRALQASISYTLE
jgi:hypothetical protein